MTQLLAGSGCLLVLVASMAVLSVCHERGIGSPETVRKTLHVEMGLLAAGAPWLFDSSWQIVLLACLALVWLLAVRRFAPLRRRFGGALHGVSRRSHGESFFVAGIAVTYLLSADQPAYYCAAILTMTLADTAAAAVGRRIGRYCYGDAGARKSLEGSCAFFCTAFACTTSALAALTSSPPVSVMTAALVVAVVTTVLEAASVDGADNLLVPVSAIATMQLILGAAGPAYFVMTVVSVSAIAILWGSRPRLRGFDLWERRDAR